MRTMYDSTNVNDIPANAKMVAGYVDGIYANVWSLQRNFPHAVVVRIAVSPHTNDGHVLDVEPGDATPAQAVDWVRMRRISGADPTIYCSKSSWYSVRKAFKDAGVEAPHYWIADWDGIKEVPTGTVAKQYGNPDITHHHYDISAVADHWPGVDAPHNPRGTDAASYYVVKSGDTLSQIAVRYHLTLRQILDLNNGISDPNMIFIGDKLRISGKSTSPHTNAVYTVRKGDTMTSIAASHHITLAALEKLNHQIKNFDLIYPGQHIYL